MSQRRCVEDLEAYPLKPNPTVTTGATGVVYQMETMMLCNASQELNDWQSDRARPRLLSQLLRVWANRPSSIFCRHRCAQHCKCSIGMGREPNTLPHAGHCSSLTKSLAIALCPWARDLWACLAFSLVKTRTHSCGHSGHNSTPAGRSATWVHEKSTVLMQSVSCQLDS